VPLLRAWRPSYIPLGSLPLFVSDQSLAASFAGLALAIPFAGPLAGTLGGLATLATLGLGERQQWALGFLETGLMGTLAAEALRQE
jgi:hypothetical protein